MSVATLSRKRDRMRGGQKLERYAAFHVPWMRHACARLVGSHRGFWIKCGNLESHLLADRLGHIEIERPIYIAGLARAGSTVLLETIAAHSGVSTHRYRDFPFLFTPYWWNRFVDRARRRKGRLAPRAHADGLMMSPESPEAMEEVLWMAFFPEAHDRARPHVLDAATARPDFERFYRDHIRKLLAVRGGNRYAAKGNYHISRLEYLLSLFEGARFVVPVRRPREHVASLIKQHRLFSEGETRYPRSLDSMRFSGHFEFGLDRRVIHLGDGAQVREIERLWESGEEVRGWACYWKHIYSFVADRLAASEPLRRATLIVRFEDLCQAPHETIRRIVGHCELPDDERLRDSLGQKIQSPTYYQPDFTPAEERTIEEETQAVARLFGYPET